MYFLHAPKSKNSNKHVLQTWTFWGGGGTKTKVGACVETTPPKSSNVNLPIKIETKVRLKEFYFIWLLLKFLTRGMRIGFFCPPNKYLILERLFQKEIQ
jgi:hypothetical protein